jgi:hypothetical protein
MRTSIGRFLSFAGLILVTAPRVFPQGSLTPPGAPAPTMKTLAQIEPRTPISSVPLTINSSGSYYLTQNVSVSTGNAIDIEADNVTLDLNGFTISSTASPSGGTAINLIGRNVTILNGLIKSGATVSGGVYSGTGFRYGIYDVFVGDAAPSNLRVSSVSVSGVLGLGIYLGSSSIVQSCKVDTVGITGIGASYVSDSVATNCGAVAGIEALTANNSTGISIDGTGVSVYNAYNCTGGSANGDGVNAVVIAANCYGYSASNGNGTRGVLATTASHCYGTASVGSGVVAKTAENCWGDTVSGSGVFAETANNCYGQSFTSGTGLSATIAIGCIGKSDSGTGLSAFTANSCRGTSNSGTAQSITNKYNMP